MTEAQARSVLSRCPSLGDLDVRLAQRRLRQLDRDMHISRWVLHARCARPLPDPQLQPVVRPPRLPPASRPHQPSLEPRSAARPAAQLCPPARSDGLGTGMQGPHCMLAFLRMAAERCQGRQCRWDPKSFGPQSRVLECRCEAALLVLRHPQQLLPHPADVVEFAVSHRSRNGRRTAPPS